VLILGGRALVTHLPILARKVLVRSLSMHFYKESFEGPEELWRLSWCEQARQPPVTGYVNGSQSL